MQKIIVSRKEFLISKAGIEWLAANGNAKAVAKLQLSPNNEELEMNMKSLDLKRDNPLLVEMLETLGSECHTPMCTPEITEVEDGIEWEITVHNGVEWVIQFEPTEPVVVDTPTDAKEVTSE